MRCRSIPAAFPALVVLLVALPLHDAAAQRRPGVSTGFYTTTGLLTGEVEAGSVNSSTVQTESPTFAVSALVTAPVVKRPHHAWIVGARATALSLGYPDQCVRPLGGVCESRRYTERGALLAGGSFDVRSTVLRLLVGPALYQVEETGTRVGTGVRIDFAAPRLRGPTPTIFYTRSFMGSQGGRGVGISTFGAGLRWVRKT